MSAALFCQAFISRNPGEHLAPIEAHLQLSSADLHGACNRASLVKSFREQAIDSMRELARESGGTIANISIEWRDRDLFIFRCVFMKGRLL